MTADRAPLEHADLAELLTGAAQRISDLISAEYPAPVGRSYLRPVLGPLSAGPGIVGELTERLEGLFAEPLPTSSASLFILASYASALGWLTESLVELTETVALVPGLLDTVTEAVLNHSEVPGPHRVEELIQDFAALFTDDEWNSMLGAAEATGLPAEAYVITAGVVSAAALTFRTDCEEIASGLREDASYVATQAPGRAATGEGSGSLPALVRSLLARMEMETAQ
ncbi:hypothetical protein [Actinacidiphila acididurans]|uniref:Uncharacterized protein n=1 Tax=Actinacidiphila acididurans TaxID=2784346 RepID=A0ABS2TXE9_9ACTN|nr:hypothetical protein [Actinacidiphila acididurans]MBM9508019.1 hypothetical protein [Actinacidiphila acididurans]